MRLTDVAVLIVISGLFCPVYSNQIKSIGQLNKRIHQSIQRRDSVRFISASFRNVCVGKGFSDFDKWAEVCGEMWELDSIKWKKTEEEGSVLYHGRWSGSCGSGEVYCRKKMKKTELGANK